MVKARIPTRELVVTLLLGSAASFMGQGVAWALHVSALPRVSLYGPFIYLFNAGLVYAVYRTARTSSPYGVAAWLVSLALARGLLLTSSDLIKMNWDSGLIAASLARESLKGLAIYGVIYAAYYALEAQRRA